MFACGEAIIHLCGVIISQSLIIKNYSNESNNTFFNSPVPFICFSYFIFYLYKPQIFHVLLLYKIRNIRTFATLSNRAYM
jgi:hypothetical protein